MPEEITRIGGMHKADIALLVREGDDAVRDEVVRMVEDLKDGFESLRTALIGYTDELGNRVPGALEELNARIAVLQKERIEENRIWRLHERSRHENWQEGEDLREIARAKRDEAQALRDQELMRLIETVHSELKDVKITVAKHEDNFVSNFTKTKEWLIETYNSSHKKWLVLAAAWAAITTAFSAAVAVVLKGVALYKEFSGVIHAVAKTIRDSLSK